MNSAMTASARQNQNTASSVMILKASSCWILGLSVINERHATRDAFVSCDDDALHIFVSLSWRDAVPGCAPFVSACRGAEPAASVRLEQQRLGKPFVAIVHG